ncbi:NUDIX domain-containing protein [Microbulbifer hainanensis]|uniref:NUDIX domain-containing protein n=1 Tax=Microbulbifer hainanensis TaxID=2735675 RepID=UPI0018663EE8|nr:NUDIX domain-containing protein [Microbulbifer hainanensis]
MSEQREPPGAGLASQFTRSAVDVIERTPVFEGFFTMVRLRLRHRLYRGGWSAEFERELFVRGAAVGVLLYDPLNELVALTEQFRVGALERPGGPWCLEVVAGMVEPEESLQEVARREVLEEAGMAVDEFHYIRTYMPSPGGSSERMHLFCALANLRDAEGHFGLSHEHEDIRLRVFPLQEVLEAMESGEPGACPIDNAATVISLQWLQLNRARLDELARSASVG